MNTVPSLNLAGLPIKHSLQCTHCAALLFGHVAFCPYCGAEEGALADAPRAPRGLQGLHDREKKIEPTLVMDVAPTHNATTLVAASSVALDPPEGIEDLGVDTSPAELFESVGPPSPTPSWMAALEDEAKRSRRNMSLSLAACVIALAAGAVYVMRIDDAPKPRQLLIQQTAGEMQVQEVGAEDADSTRPAQAAPTTPAAALAAPTQEATAAEPPPSSAPVAASTPTPSAAPTPSPSTKGNPGCNDALAALNLCTK